MTEKELLEDCDLAGQSLPFCMRFCQPSFFETSDSFGFDPRC